MQKHSDLTRRRIEQFIKFELEPKMISDEEPLEIWFCEIAHGSQRKAEPGPWKLVEKGFRYGPAYQTFWFKLTGAVPQRFEGQSIALMAEVGGERTIWRDGTPWVGVDIEHEVVPLWTWGYQGVVPVSVQACEPVEFVIESYTRNPQVSVHRQGPPREPTVEEVKFAKLVCIDVELKDLYYDAAFCLSLLEACPDNEPEYHTILRALNRVCNLYSESKRDTIASCRKVLRDALNSINSESSHTVVPVGHAHLDTAWLWPISITRQKMAHTTVNQLRLMERYPEYVFVHSQASQYEWLEEEYPCLFDQVKAAIDRGQWEPVGSMWVEADCNLTGSESLVRQFLYGRKYFRDKFDFETQDMWLPDVFGYSAALPQILRGFNIKYFLTQKISWNQFNKFPHNTFWWQGIDGTRAWSHFPPADTYIGDGTPKQLVESVRKHKDHARSDSSLYVFGWGDGGGGPTEKHLEFLRRARSAPILPDVQLGRTAAQFFKDAKAKSRDLPVWVGELYLELHRGTYTSQAANKKANRVSEFLLRDAELLACFAPNQSYPAAELESAWKLTLLNQFHDIIPGSSVREVYEDSDADYKRVAEICTDIIERSLTAIGDRLDTSSMERPYAVFQNAAVPTQVEIPWVEDQVPTSAISDDEAYPLQFVEEFGEKKLIFQTPACALEAVSVMDLSDAAPNIRYRLKAGNRKIENEELAVRFDSNGAITSIQSLDDSSEFIRPGSQANVFQLLEDKPVFWSAWDVDLYSFETAKDIVPCESFEIVERGPVRVAVEIVRKFSNSTIRQRISLGPTPGIRFDTEVDWHETDKMLKVAFPLNVNAMRATYEIQFGHVERPTHYNTSWDMARFEVPAQKWADLSEGDHGVALLNDCKYGHDIQGNVMRLSLLRSPKAPDEKCDMGLHRFTYVLLPHFGPPNQAGVVHSAYSLNAPMRFVPLSCKEGAISSLPPFVTCDDRNIVIESVKQAEDGEGIIVRLYECHNSRGRAEIVCAHEPSQVTLCDLEESEHEEVEIVEGVVPFRYTPFQILTFRFRF